MVSAWSIPQSKRQPLDNKENVPGPGQYVPEYYQGKFQKQNPKYSIGNSNRSDFGANNTPAPGQYGYRQYIGKEAPKYHIGEKRNLNYEEKEKQKWPGPSTYSPTKTNFRKFPQYSIGIKFQLHNKINIPGPGNYDVNRTTLNSPSTAMMGAQNRTDLAYNKDVPGPGQYQQNKNIILRTFPKFSIGHQERSGLLGQIYVPGVGQYNIKQKDQIKGGCISGKNFQKEEIFKPCPGYYSPRTDQKDTKYGVFGKEIRQTYQITNSPGPQKYITEKYDNLKLKQNPKFSIGNSKRQPLGGNESPGPSQYKLKEIWNSNKGVIIQEKHMPNQANQIPGPSDYQPKYNYIKTKNSSYTTPHSKRLGLVDLKEKGKIPGPSDYNWAHKRSQSPEYSIGRSQRVNLAGNNANPGVGQYNLPPKFADVPKYLLMNVKQKKFF